MQKKPENKRSLKNTVKKFVADNKDTIAAAAAVAATELGPIVTEKIKNYAHDKFAHKPEHKLQHKPKPANRPAQKHKVKHHTVHAAPAAHTAHTAKPAEQPQKAQKQLVKISHYQPKHHKSNVGHKLAAAVTRLLTRGIRNIILFALLGCAAFSAGAYYIFIYATQTRAFPLWYIIFLGVVDFAASGLFGLFYGGAMALLYSLKTFSFNIGDLVKDAAHRVKQMVEGRVQNISDTLKAGDAANVVQQVFADINRTVRQYAAGTAAGVVAISLLSGIIFLARAAVMRGMHKVKNKADFVAALSARASLALAVVLNLKLFATWALRFGLLVGLLAICLQAIVILWVK